ncbi:TPA: type IV pilus biogenesis protein PilM [Enterobacter roggenkampii]|uniref:type IV pilus biogenesis protein PilM n=1 Tax=Klebsiella aerogenes TaxID=548 RepID=UPI002FF0CB20
MLSLNNLIFVVLLVVTSSLTTSLLQSQSEKIDRANIDVSARALLVYVDAANIYTNSNPNTSGILTNKISLPTWFKQTNGYNVYNDGINTFIYTPSTPGLMSRLRTMTKGSKTLGLSNQNTIILNGGLELPKPAIVPANQVVYIL